MNDLVQRLSVGQHRLAYSRGDAVKGLEAAIERRFVLLKFTETRGGTDLGIPLDVAACNWASADFGQAKGRIHLEGELELDYVPVRVIADLDLDTLSGEGCLRVIGRS